MTYLRTKRADDVTVAKQYVKKYQRAMQLNHEFNLSFAEFAELVNTTHCYYTGIELTRKNGQSDKGADFTLERLDSSKGYVSGNVVACCRAANQAKSHWEDPKAIIKFDEARKILAKCP